MGHSWEEALVNMAWDSGGDPQSIWVAWYCIFCILHFLRGKNITEKQTHEFPGSLGMPLQGCCADTRGAWGLAAGSSWCKRRRRGQFASYGFIKCNTL